MAQANSSTATAPAAETSGGRLRIKLVKSPIGYSQRQRDTVRALGLRKLHQVVEQDDSAVIRGMVFKVKHLVQVIEE